jgi:hypothetical protein
VTETEFKALLARLPREEKEMLLRLPPKEAMVIIELHLTFPGAHRVEEPA